MSTFEHQHAVTAGPTIGGSSSLATSNSVNDLAATSSPTVLSGGGSLATSSSKLASQSMIPSSVTNREGDLASSSSADVGLLSGSVAGVVECLPTGDEKPSTWNKNGEVVDYFIPRHHALLPFPSPALWNLSHRTVSDNIETSKSTQMYTISEWSLVYTNSLRHFQFVGHWHGPDDIYNAAGHTPRRSIRPPPLISSTDFTAVPHTFNQSAPWYAYIPRSPSDPPPFSNEVCSEIGNELLLGGGYIRACRLFLNRSERVYRGWQEIAGEWLKDFVFPRQPIVPDWIQGRTMPEAFASIVNQNQRSSSMVNSLLTYAYECNGYAAFLMYACIDKLVQLCNVTPPAFAVDDRVVGAILSDPLASREMEWRDELVRRGVPVWVVREMRTRRDTFPDRHHPTDIASAPSRVAEALKVSKSMVWHRIRLEIPLRHVQHPVQWRILPQDFHEDDGAKPFVERVLDSFLPGGATSICLLSRRRLHELHQIFGPGSFFLPPVLPDPPPSAPNANLTEEFRIGFDSEDEDYDDNDDNIYVGDSRRRRRQVNARARAAPSSKLQQDPFESDLDFRARVSARRKEEELVAQHHEAAKELISAAYNGDFRARESVEQSIKDARGKKDPSNARGGPAKTEFQMYLIQHWNPEVADRATLDRRRNFARGRGRPLPSSSALHADSHHPLASVPVPSRVRRQPPTIPEPPASRAPLSPAAPITPMDLLPRSRTPDLPPPPPEVSPPPPPEASPPSPAEASPPSPTEAFPPSPTKASPPSPMDIPRTPVRRDSADVVSPPGPDDLNMFPPKQIPLTQASPTPPSLNTLEARQPQGQATEAGSQQHESPVHSVEPPTSVGVDDTKESRTQDQGQGHTQGKGKVPDRDSDEREHNRERRPEHEDRGRDRNREQEREWDREQEHEQERERERERGWEQRREKGKECEHEQRGAWGYDQRWRQEQTHPNDYGHARIIRGPERSHDHEFEGGYDDRRHGSGREHNRGHRYDPLLGPRPSVYRGPAFSGPSHMRAPHTDSTEWSNVAGPSKHAPEVRRAPNFGSTHPPTGPRADRPPVTRAFAQPAPPTLPAPPAPPVVATSIAPRPDAIPLKSWYCIDVSPVLEADTNLDWLLRLRQWGVLSARKSKPTRHKGAAYHIFLMFKSEAKRNACREFLKNEKTRYSLTTVEDYVWEKPIQNFVGLIDVYYIDRVYAHARSDEELARLLDIGPPTLDRGSPLGQIFLDYQRHPPVPVDRDALTPRKMDVAEFSASWYSARLASAPAGSVTVWMRRLEMMMLSHIDGMAIGNPVKSHFQEAIWRTTGGTMVADLRRIARWRQENVRTEGSQLKTVVAKEETFGRMKGNAVWRLILDLTLEQPWYPS